MGKRLEEKSSEKVLLCKNPAIKEAFCLIQGKPAVLDDSEAPSLENAAKIFYEEQDIRFERVPTFVVIPIVKDKEINAFWSQQSKWGETNLARYGHRYLSIHRICSNKDKYKSFEESLAPEIKQWLSLYNSTLVSKKDPHEIGLITFGYINEFIVSHEVFNLAKLVHLDFNIAIDKGYVDSLNSSTLKFDFFNSSKDINTTIKVNIGGILGDPSNIKLTVEIYSTFGNIQGLCYNDNVMEKVQALKDHAKDTFFSFATDYLRDEIMGAQYVKK